jgi:hypothetical protein
MEIKKFLFSLALKDKNHIHHLIRIKRLEVTQYLPYRNTAVKS